MFSFFQLLLTLSSKLKWIKREEKPKIFAVVLTNQAIRKSLYINFILDEIYLHFKHNAPINNGNPIPMRNKKIFLPALRPFYTIASPKIEKKNPIQIWNVIKQLENNTYSTANNYISLNLAFYVLFLDFNSLVFLLLFPLSGNPFRIHFSSLFLFLHLCSTG